MAKTLSELRNLIDATDKELLALLNRRAVLAGEVGDIKRIDGSPVFRPEREAQVINGLQDANPGPLKNASVAHIWREIMSACRSLEAPQRVAYLGPAGTFSEMAALQFFGTSIEHVPCSSFDEIFHAATAGNADFGVVPVENSTEGVVTRTLDLFLNTPLHVVGEISFLVRHHLLRLTDSLESIEVVLAHSQALAQCQDWLSKHLPHAERRAVSSNAEGARLAATNPAWAAIASERAGTEFGLHIAAHAIQDDAYNRTRFAVVCLPQTLPMPAASGKDCVSLIVSVPNRPGAVHDLLIPL
ncbi:chorismate mutase, partial [Polaromonas sp.]|uniref:chorismate mutase n=1 Tax=Polaromonas sp. TaxID=1869339 RepID=UPI0027301C63